jgi:hypothetical protein
MSRKYTPEQKARQVAYDKRRYQNNKVKLLAQKKQYYQENKDKITAHNKQYYQENKDEIGAWRKQYAKDHKSEIAARKKLYHEGHKAEAKNHHLQDNFGISLKQYNELFDLQQGCCAICGAHQTKLSKALAVDHDHETGEIRGLLCSGCNFILGHAKDDIGVLANAIKYLEENTLSGE